MQFAGLRAFVRSVHRVERLIPQLSRASLASSASALGYTLIHSGGLAHAACEVYEAGCASQQGCMAVVNADWGVLTVIQLAIGNH